MGNQDSFKLFGVERMHTLCECAYGLSDVVHEEL